MLTKLLGIFIVLAHFNSYTIVRANPPASGVGTQEKPDFGRQYQFTKLYGKNAIIICDSNQPGDKNEYTVYSKIMEANYNRRRQSSNTDPKLRSADGRMYLPYAVSIIDQNGRKCITSMFECQANIAQFMQTKRMEGKVMDSLPLLDQAIRGFAYLHRLGWTHNNIRPEAICVNGIDKQQPTILIHDFQAATPILYGDANELRLHIPKQPYLIDSPEWKTKTASNLQQADSWSIGAVFYGILLSNTYMNTGGETLNKCVGYVLRETASATTLEAFMDLLLEKVTFLSTGGKNLVFNTNSKPIERCAFPKYYATRMVDNKYVSPDGGLQVISSIVAMYPVELLAQTPRFRSFVSMILQQGVCNRPFIDGLAPYANKLGELYKILARLLGPTTKQNIRTPVRPTPNDLIG
ncbi:hypothetical protein BDF22DRAFT_233845 [Syncephalis plumigaleata]|nr:hypothetical protein BDF22DRAFT_233845 [Syncephalis plumigaleata]